MRGEEARTRDGLGGELRSRARKDTERVQTLSGGRETTETGMKVRGDTRGAAPTRHVGEVEGTCVRGFWYF